MYSVNSDFYVSTDGEEKQQRSEEKDKAVTFVTATAEFLHFSDRTHEEEGPPRRKEKHRYFRGHFLKKQVCSAFTSEAETVLHTNCSVLQV